MVTVAYDTCSIQVWFRTTCPETLIVTLGDVLESANAKNGVNLACFNCTRCGVLHIVKVHGPAGHGHFFFSYTYSKQGVHAQKCEYVHCHSRVMIL